MTVLPLLWAGTGLDAEEFRDAIRMRYGLVPEGMVERCEGFGKPFTVEHSLYCKVGGQVLARHNDLNDEWAGLSGSAFGRSNVYDEPLIKTSRDVREAGEETTSDPLGEDRGDVAVHGFWKKRQGAIFEVFVTDK